MSLLHPASQTSQSDSDVQVPAVLPVADIDIDIDGSLRVTLDGQARPFERAGRDQIPDVVAALTRELATPVRLQIHEPDGNTFTDIVLPREAAGHTGPPPGSGTGNGAEREATRTGEFIPDEEIVIAVVVAHQQANAEGALPLRLPQGLLAARGDQLLFIGTDSGVVLSLQELP